MPRISSRPAGSGTTTNTAAVERMFQQVENRRLQKFAKTAAATWGNPGLWVPQALDRDRKRIIGTKDDTVNGVSIGYSDDDGITYTTVKTLTPVTTGNTENLLAEAVIQDGAGEVWVGTSGTGAYWGQIWKSTGWAANPATATWARVIRAPFAQLSTKVSGDYHGIAHDGASTFVTAWYDKKTNNAGGVAANAAVTARKSTDSGTTWTDVFRLDTYLSAQGIDPLANGYHLHSVEYDPVWGAWWLTFGDTDGTVGRCGMVYSLDGCATWNTAYIGTGSVQSVSIYPMLDCVLFLGDGGSASGVNRLARDPSVRGSIGAMTKPYSFGGLNAIGELGYANREPGGWLLLSFTQITGASRVSRLVGTADGTNFYDLYIDTTYTVTGVSGLRRVIGPNANGRVIGWSANDGGHSLGGTSSILTLSPVA